MSRRHLPEHSREPGGKIPSIALLYSIMLIVRIRNLV
jgi:hypothetical protein